MSLQTRQTGNTTFPGWRGRPAPSEPVARQADLLYFADVEDRSVEWLWQDRLAVGSLAMIAGDPGSGKTWVALAIAAALSRGQIPAEVNQTTPSSGEARQPCTILYASTHNLGAEIIRPRFLSLDGDPARLVLFRGVSSSGSLAPLGLWDTAILEDALQRTGARLLIIDPLHSYLAADDRHRAHAAARLFDNLAQLADKHRCCILLVRHLRRRGRSSPVVELSGAVRTEFLVGSNPDAPASPALVQTKSNLGPLAPSLGYRLLPSGPAFQWTGPSRLTPDDLQADRPIGAGLPQRKLAAEWLRQHLGDGPQTQGTIERAALRDGVCMITVRRAKFDIGATSNKSSFDGAWYWELPQDQSPGDASRGGKNKK